MNRYCARWLFPGDGPPLRNATIEIKDGCIHDVGCDASDAIDLGDVAILPGLINAHTHLEFSAITSPLEPLNDFPEWIRSVIQWRQQSTSFSATFTATFTADSLRDGLFELQRSGVTSLAEIATIDWRQKLSDQQPTNDFSSILMSREYLGLSEENVERALNDAEEFLAAHSQSPFTAGLSPHAPYSVHPSLLEGLCQLAEKYQSPLAMHLAESPAEMELLQTGGGPFAEMLKSLGVFRKELFARSRKPIHFLEVLDCDVPVLIIHGNLLDEDEMQFIAKRPNMTVVYCPRTFAAMQQFSHPWRRMIELGINVVLGTDSRASNPDLSIWNELSFLSEQNPDIATSELLKLATINSAKGLNLANQGVLKKGFEANFCLIPLTKLTLEKPEELLSKHSTSPNGTMVRGEWRVVPDFMK